MFIDKVRARRVFDDYVSNYDIDDEKIKLKIEHTYRVSEICENLAKSIGFAKEDIELSWLMGLLHDIGRFEQVRKYGTFNDSQSVDHAKLGVEILFDEGKIRDFIEDDREDELIRNAIDCHNAYRIPTDFSERTGHLSNILRDADKIDILKVNVIVPLEDIYNVTSEELYNSTVTKEVMDNLKEQDTVLRKLKRTAVDNVVGHISLVYGLVYDESINIVEQQGYLEQLMDFKSNNTVTNIQFEEIRELIHSYISKRRK